MTVAELHFLERVPNLLAGILSELKTLNETLANGLPPRTDDPQAGD